MRPLRVRIGGGTMALSTDWGGRDVIARVAPALTIRAVRAVGVEVPMTYALGTSAGKITTAALVLVDVDTEEGVTGRSYLFCFSRDLVPAILRMIEAAAAALTGDKLTPVALWDKLSRRFKLIGVTGIVRMALAAIDVAAWDAVAIAAGLPLARLLGAAPRPIPAYNSCGLGLMTPQEVADEAEKLLAGGFRAIKLRLGYPTLAADLAALQAVRQRVGADVIVMVDYNQALTVAQALERGRALDQKGIYWLEEPIRHDDYAGNARLVRELRSPVQIGESFNLITAIEAALDAGAADYVMPDLDRIGGVTGFMQAAALAAARGIEMSSHLFPEVSAHLLAATPTAHWLEYMDWANPILAEPMKIVDGHAVIPERPGNGLAWNPDAVAHYRIA
jgi:mandelate racemase